jgi:imidazolonepropionase-like amidohydrolase
LRSEGQEVNDSIENVNPTEHISKAAGKMDIASMDSWANRITLEAYKNGVSIAAGTDFSSEIKWVQDEIILLTDCGLTNFDAIKAATLNNAKAIGIEDTHGSIATGKIANLVVLADNPVEDIKNIRSVVSVYKNGVSYEKKE